MRSCTWLVYSAVILLNSTQSKNERGLSWLIGLPAPTYMLALRVLFLALHLYSPPLTDQHSSTGYPVPRLVRCLQ